MAFQDDDRPAEFRLSVGGWGAARRRRALRTGFEQRAQTLLEHAYASDTRWEKVVYRGYSERRRAEPWVLRRSPLVVSVAALVAVAAFVLGFRTTNGADKDRFDIGLRSAAAVAALAAGALTWGRLELSRHEHRLGAQRDLHERYSRSIEQIANEDRFIHIGGIYALERFALDAARTDSSEDVVGDWRLALDVLATLARSLSDEAKTDGSSAPPQAVIEAVRVLGRFAQRSGRQNARATFHEFNLALAGVRPSASAFSARTATAHQLAAVIAPGVELSGASLAGSVLVGADLSGAQLAGAHLVSTNLTDAMLAGADLAGVELFLADLARADLSGANLDGANLMGADLTGANLSQAVLTGANLTNATLRGAILTDAKLRGAILWGAVLHQADLTGAQLDDANLDDIGADESTVWPEGVVVTFIEAEDDGAT